MSSKEILITLPTRRPFKNVYQFKITLLDTDPPVWRRIQVPESYTFYDLHVAIQNAMGWTDSHLHQFEIEDENFPGKIQRIESPYCLEEIEEDEFLITTEISLKSYFHEAGNKGLYEYDFGDGWQHEVCLEEILPKQPGVKYPRCLAGELACPPEDCGGISGYYECVRAVKKHDNSDGMLTWLRGWKPNRFDPRNVKFENPRKRLEDSMG